MSRSMNPIKRLFLLLTSVAVGGCAHGPGHHGPEGNHGHKSGEMHHDFSDAKRWAKVFDDPERDVWQKPGEVVGLMKFSKGMWVADIGAGTGYFLPHLHSGVGESGVVVAVDLPSELVAHMNDRALAAGWRNVFARRALPDDPLLAAGSMDRILIVDTWHHIENRVAYGKKLLQALKPSGALYVVDFEPASPRGPKHHKLSKEQIASELKEAGFRVSFEKETLQDQYIVVGRR